MPDEALRLLHVLALFKIGKLMSEGMRLRTACDLAVESLTVTAPRPFELPTLDSLEADLRQAITQCKPHFADPPVTELRFGATEASKRSSKRVSRKTTKPEGPEP